MGDGLKPEQRWLTELTLLQAEDPPAREPTPTPSRASPPPAAQPSLAPARESLLAPLAVAFSRHEARLTRYAARITHDADLARDVVQDVFARLCREPPADSNGHLAPWLYAACRNRAIDLRRKDSRVTFAADAAVFAIAGLSRGHQPARSAESQASRGLQSARSSGAKDEPHVALDPASHAATRDETAKVLRILGELPSSQQEAVCLRFSCGLSYKEIAAVMELSVSHVGVLLHNAIAALRERMGG